MSSTFFYFFKAPRGIRTHNLMFTEHLRYHCARGAYILRPSCRPRSISSQSPSDAGSHLYTAQQDSVRWWDFIVKSYCGNLRLGGLPLLPSLTLCTYYNTFVLGCQQLFLFFSAGVRSTRTDPTAPTQGLQRESSQNPALRYGTNDTFQI